MQLIQPEAHPEPEELAAYSSGDLQADEARRVEEHVVRCPECEAQVLDFGDMLTLLHSLPEYPAPRSFAIDELSARRASRFWPAYASLAASLLLAVAMAAALARSGASGPSSPTGAGSSASAPHQQVAQVITMEATEATSASGAVLGATAFVPPAAGRSVAAPTAAPRVMAATAASGAARAAPTLVTASASARASGQPVSAGIAQPSQGESRPGHVQGRKPSQPRGRTRVASPTAAHPAQPTRSGVNAPAAGAVSRTSSVPPPATASMMRTSSAPETSVPASTTPVPPSGPTNGHIFSIAGYYRTLAWSLGVLSLAALLLSALLFARARRARA